MAEDVRFPAGLGGALVAATGVGLMFPTASAMGLMPAAVAGAGLALPVAAMVAAGAAGWYIGKAIAGRGQEAQAANENSPSRAGQAMMAVSPGKEWVKSEALRRDVEAERER